MKKIIPLDKKSRIVIDSGNYILQYLRKSKTKISWRTDGYFPDLASLYQEYKKSAPQRADNAINSIQELTDSIKKAEARICQIIIKK